MCSNYRGIISLPGKVYAGVLEKRVQMIAKSQIQEQCGCPGCETLDQLYTLTRILEGAWEFAQPVPMCFVDLEKAFDCVFCGSCGGYCTPGVWGSGPVVMDCPVSAQMELVLHCLVHTADC